MKSNLLKFLSKIYRLLFFWKYPYIYSLNFDKAKIDFFITNRVDEFRIKKWGGEEGYVRYILSKLKPHDNLYIVGASVGFTSILASSRLLRGGVIAFEPDAIVYKKFLDNIKINKIKNIKTFKYALGERRTRKKLFYVTDNNMSASMINVRNFNKSTYVLVVPMDDLVEKEKLPYPTVVKIDVEGAEMNVLKGMKNVLKSKHKPRMMFIEIHKNYLKEFNSSEVDLVKYLKKMNYELKKKIVRNQEVLCEFR
ncbi:hypothetical protein A3A76_03675 [Candidatus Woesebacteria bacterium RIFCSPLOWO2_01_FULL_39_23]|uniref:Methyltransferase FkbM domain-containing protein n=1 Tax=Candidatus Woesebacteria bacterium RIFCSPHIGHO2_01_FULL_40_22 TaxID=1802499 RepID=A0A1F7YJM5_9BACT|nr:MAG: hypothetical protein A2141_00350 [Candidatus Woesebacteria bacterium RBG_16_40_11]OGM27554.1 MAG: hypothetical protein A2628_02075 [Candidatus Woesebacteria bacterium RIFCSPHIGHO2_01_FULL_40_22]OGM36145.1 MAG: hypothetical protein A3E41_02315 [Candidatus Woesebacteria bacterium RIFCSPHIGHO2_12_FULL_38_9]OGM62728.1 MAG: hypothetical protein A3A76_03675 [Candidatus Woesebacteria bacterium RIFCSPLOWO2_01_FULL_39_23]